jgi:hypothetical protein
VKPSTGHVLAEPDRLSRSNIRILGPGPDRHRNPDTRQVERTGRLADGSLAGPPTREPSPTVGVVTVPLIGATARSRQMRKRSYLWRPLYEDESAGKWC